MAKLNSLTQEVGDLVYGIEWMLLYLVCKCHMMRMYVCVSLSRAAVGRTCLTS